jgi:IrrE N-terminal-like domain
MVQRGFGARADRLAAAVRAELGLGTDDRLVPAVLAAEYGVAFVPITDLIGEGADPASVRQLTTVDEGCFSAGTVMAGTARLIIFNPVHPDGRVANSLVHELAHLILEHTPGAAIGPGGCRVWDKEMEDEADRLAAVLLIPREAALACARVGLPHVVGAARFGVSTALMQWRTDHSGATRQAQAAARRRGRTIPRVSAAEVRAIVDASQLEWLLELTGPDWRALLARWGRTLATGSVPSLIRCLQPTAQR